MQHEDPAPVEMLAKRGESPMAHGGGTPEESVVAGG